MFSIKTGERNYRQDEIELTHPASKIMTIFKIDVTNVSELHIFQICLIPYFLVIIM